LKKGETGPFVPVTTNKKESNAKTGCAGRGKKRGTRYVKKTS